MKRLLQLGFILGLAGTLAAVHFIPRFEYERYRSASDVVANGGRSEQFMVRLPADRIGAPIASPEGAEAGAVRLEHFKLRDVNGNIIGIVARHEVERDAGFETAWLLSIPSRGSIALTARYGADTVTAALQGHSLEPGQAFEHPLSMDAPAAARSVSVTGEFAGIDFELIETWVVTGVDENGQTVGTLRLNTIGRRSS